MFPIEADPLPPNSSFRRQPESRYVTEGKLDPGRFRKQRVTVMRINMSWQWDQITALSTVVGVVGGLISVYFLVLEIRRNAQATEGATVQSLMSMEKDVFGLLANNARLYVRGCEDISKLSAEEKFQFERLVATQMSLYYCAFVQFGQELIDDEVWEAYANALKRYLGMPGFRLSWKTMELQYPKSFRDTIGKC